MNKKEHKFLNQKLQELVNNNIISDEQYNDAKMYFEHSKKDNKSIVTIFSAIGIFLMALSIITLFAINWRDIGKEIKIIISFVPIAITSIMLYFCIRDENKKVQLYTSIFAPISILATNSLIAQIFHIQTEIYELIFISILMFMPIAFILRNSLSIIVYGIGTIMYSFTAMSLLISEKIVLINTFIISLPLIIYNVVCYKNNRKDNRNLLMWIINITLITMLLLFKELFRPDVLLIYIYLIYLITRTLFDKNNNFNRMISTSFIFFLIISCMYPFMAYIAEEIEFGFDTLIITALVALFMYLSESYKDIKEYFILAFVLLIQYVKMDSDIVFVLLNIIAIGFGVFSIISGNKKNSNKEIKQGISIIIIIILFRFMSSDLSFGEKSVMFLIAGICFMIGAKVMKKRVGGKENEKINDR